jgi:protoheme IX farnesyltransferase
VGAVLITVLGVGWYTQPDRFVRGYQPGQPIPYSSTAIAAVGSLVWGHHMFTSGMGDPADVIFFFIWQVPHFWLLLFAFGADYEKAGLPSLTKLFSRRQLARLTFIWMLATFVSSLLLSMYGLAYSPWISLGFIACGIWLAWEASKLLRAHSERQSFWPAFRSINLYALCIMALLVTDAML